MERASRRFWNPLNAIFRPGKARAKGNGKALARWAKVARKGFGPWWNVLRAGFETLLNAESRPGKAGAKGERCTGGFRVLVKRAWRRRGNRLNAIFDLAKRWQRAITLHGGFWGPGGTCFAQVLKPSKCSIATWQGKGKGQSAGKGLKLPGRVWGPGGTCFAQVLKPSKCRISTWQGRGSERCTGGFRVLDLAKRWQRPKAARRVLGAWGELLRAGFETL